MNGRQDLHAAGNVINDGVHSYSYDANGNVVTKIAPAPNQTGSATVTTTYTYDALNRLTQKGYSDGSTPAVNYYYDNNVYWGAPLTNTVGRLIWSVVAGRVGAQLSYDPMGRIKTRWQCNADCSVAYQTNVGYNLFGQPITRTGPAIFNLTQNYDSAGRLAQVISTWNDAQHPTALATVDPATGFDPAGGVRKLLLGNGLTETMVYNKRLQSCRFNLNSAGTALSNCGDAIPSGNVLDFAYSFNLGASDNGNLTSWTASGAQTWSRNYTYDELNRLKTMTGMGGVCSGLTWTYDAWGNRTNQAVTGGSCFSPSFTFNAQNRISGSPYAYDAAGNMTHDANHSYIYDAEGRITQVDSGSTATYIYDAEGKRVSKTSGGVSTEFLYDPDGNLIADKQGATWAKFYNYFNGQLFAEYVNSTTHFIHKDHLGSTRLVTGMDKSVIDSIEYQPFGEQSSGDTATTHKFTGKERDTETGLDYFGARYYGSNIGHWMSPDWSAHPIPIPYALYSDPQTLNLYSYVGNNPLSRTDADGHCTVGGETHGFWWCLGHSLGVTETKQEYNTRIANERQWLLQNARGENNAPLTPSQVSALQNASGAQVDSLYGGYRRTLFLWCTLACEDNPYSTEPKDWGRASNGELVPLIRLHSDATITSGNSASYDFWRGKSTGEIIESLKQGSKFGELTVKPNGVVMDGNTRLKVLVERGIDVNKLERVIIEMGKKPLP